MFFHVCPLIFLSSPAPEATSRCGLHGTQGALYRWRVEHEHSAADLGQNGLQLVAGHRNDLLFKRFRPFRGRFRPSMGLKQPLLGHVWPLRAVSRIVGVLLRRRPHFQHHDRL